MLNARRLSVLVSLAAFLASAAPAAAAPEGSTFLLSRPGGLGALPPGAVNDSWLGEQAAQEPGARAVSANGQFVVFASEADGLSAEDDNRLTNVFVRDTVAGTTELVSRATGPTGAAANRFSSSPSIDASGTRVAFRSEATNLGDPAGASQIYVRDLTSDTTELVSRADGAGGVPAIGYSEDAAISANGQRVAYSTSANNIHGADGNTTDDVYVRDLGSDDTILVSRASTAGGTVGNASSTNPVPDADGDRIAFETGATNFDAASDTNNSTDIYLRDTMADTTIGISRATGAGGAYGTTNANDPTINGDGTRIAFDTASGLDGADGNSLTDVYLRNTGTSETRLLSRKDGAAGDEGDASSQSPTIDFIGDTVAFHSRATNLGAEPPEEGPLVYVREIVANDTVLASRASGAGGAVADDRSFGARLSWDGTSVAFESEAANLAAGDDDDHLRVFVRALGAQTTSLVSRPTGGGGFDGNVAGAVMSGAGAVSGNGRHVVFRSNSDALLDTTADDRCGCLYLRDTLSGVTELVSRRNGAGGAPVSSDSSGASVSADGRRVAWISPDAVDPADSTTGEGGYDVYVRDRAGSTTALVSRASGNGPAGNERSNRARISASGNRVAFHSTADNLHPSDGSNDSSIFVRDLGSRQTLLASPGAGGAALNDDAFEPAIDADGSRVAFATRATNLGDGDANTNRDIHVRDLSSNKTIWASRTDGSGGGGNGDSQEPDIDAAGNRVAFQSKATNFGAAGDDNDDDVFVRDIAAADTFVVSARNATEATSGGESSRDPSIDAAGRRVAFTSYSDDLIAGDTNDAGDVFVRDIGTRATVLASRASGAGPLGNGNTGRAGLSGDGNCVAFTSGADNLGGYASPDFEQVYMRALRGPCPTPAKVLPPPLRCDQPNPPLSCDRIAPVGSSFKVSRKRFRVGTRATPVTVAGRRRKRAPRGTTFSWRLSESASTTLTIQRKAAGRRKGRRCVKPTSRLRKKRKCTRWLRAGTLKRSGVTGANKLAFSGRVGRKKLKRGTYRVTLRATDRAGNRSAARRLTFRIVRR